MAEHRIALITDSTCDIPDTLLAQYQITMVPCYIVWGQEQVRDRVGISAHDFYERLVVDPIYPKTAQPTPGDFAAVFDQLKAQGAEAIVAILISADMSGTLASAVQAASLCDLPIEIVDARGPSMTIGWQVLAAARARETSEHQAGSVDDTISAMVEAAAQARSSMQQWVLMDTIEYLRKGGRIGLASQWIGSMLKLKPLIHIDHQAGLVAPGQRVRGQKRGVEALYESFFVSLDHAQGELHIAVLHGDVLPEAEVLAERIRREHNPAELVVTITSPVLGVNTGPGALALCGYVGR